MPIRLERRYRFSASHLYRRSEWSDEENRRRFGKCANLPGHGHNYRLAVAVTGEVDPLTGFLVDLGELDRLVQQRVLAVLDHQHLNAAVPEFAAGALPTSENLVAWVGERLAGSLPAGCRLAGLRIEEDDDLAAEWSEDRES
jgi:6-pyruvoyltetrahydropterin/6-carboxytetrahydropterin synthase